MNAHELQSGLDEAKWLLLDKVSNPGAACRRAYERALDAIEEAERTIRAADELCAIPFSDRQRRLEAQGKLAAVCAKRVKVTL